MRGFAAAVLAGDCTGRRMLAAEVARLETVVRDAKGYFVGSETKERMMPLVTSRALYRMLLCLHPAEFVG